jgi:hypothetical protein
MSERLRSVQLIAFLAVAAALLAPQAALAQVRVSFYSHPWGLGRAGYLYFPHAYIVVEPDGPSASLSSRQSFGFTPVDTAIVMVTKHGRGMIIPQDERYRAVSVRHFSVEISDAQYVALERGIEAWKDNGDPYVLHTRNCISFVAQMARLVDLKVGDVHTMDPAAFLESVKQANLARINADAERMASPPAPLAPN